MLEFEILARGLYRPNQLKITYNPTLTMPTNSKTQQWIDTLWQQKLAIAQQKNIPLYDAPLFRLIPSFGPSAGSLVGAGEGKSGEGTLASPKADGMLASPPDTKTLASPPVAEPSTSPPTAGPLASPHDNPNPPQLHLHLGNTTYKEYVTTREPTFAQNRPRAELSNALAVCSVVETTDNYILLDKRQGVDTYVGRFHVIGGFFERNLDTTATTATTATSVTNPDPFAAICREIREETGIQTSDIAQQHCLGVVYDLTTPHAELCFLTRLNIPLREVHQRVPEEHEIKQLLSLHITRESLQNFILTNHGNISATGEPNLLMYGAVKFGEDWFEEMMRRLLQT